MLLLKPADSLKQPVGAGTRHRPRLPHALLIKRAAALPKPRLAPFGAGDEPLRIELHLDASLLLRLGV